MTCLRPPGWLAPAVAWLLAGWAHPDPRLGAHRELLGMVHLDEARRVMRHRRLKIRRGGKGICSDF